MGDSFVGMMCCERCGKETGVIMDRRLRNTFENGKLYANGLCDDCEKELIEFKSIVENGGIYFRCAQCKADGVIKLNDNTRSLIEEVREKQFGRDDPEWMSKAVGIEFDKCSWHVEE
jgi:hypothetical protein